MFLILWNNKIFVFIMDHLNGSIKGRTAKMGICVYWMAYIFLTLTTATSTLLYRLKNKLTLKSNYNLKNQVTSFKQFYYFRIKMSRFSKNIDEQYYFNHDECDNSSEDEYYSADDYKDDDYDDNQPADDNNGCYNEDHTDDQPSDDVNDYNEDDDDNDQPTDELNDNNDDQPTDEFNVNLAHYDDNDENYVTDTNQYNYGYCDNCHAEFDACDCTKAFCDSCGQYFHECYCAIPLCEHCGIPVSAIINIENCGCDKFRCGQCENSSHACSCDKRTSGPMCSTCGNYYINCQCMRSVCSTCGDIWYYSIEISDHQCQCPKKICGNCDCLLEICDCPKMTCYTCNNQSHNCVC